MQACCLALENVSCRRGGRLLFRGVSLALQPGEAVHVTGPNGTGKTSLLRISAGLLRPFTGKVERMGAVGLLDERPALDTMIPVNEALDFWSGVDDAQGKCSAMDRLGLTALAEVPVRYLSTGQRKRAGMARLIGQNAPIWLLDEPLSGLDEASRETAEALVREHLDVGGIVVAASHQPFAGTAMRTLDLTGFAV